MTTALSTDAEARVRGQTLGRRLIASREEVGRKRSEEHGIEGVKEAYRKENQVHIQIVNFRLEGMSEEDYYGITETIAPAFANLPGLVSKTWLANPETGTYGGVYVWQSREAMEDYKQTDIYKGMATNPSFANVTVKDFAVLEGPTRVTRGPAAGVAA